MHSVHHHTHLVSMQYKASHVLCRASFQQSGIDINTLQQGLTTKPQLPCRLCLSDKGNQPSLLLHILSQRFSRHGQTVDMRPAQWVTSYNIQAYFRDMWSTDCSCGKNDTFISVKLFILAVQDLIEPLASLSLFSYRQLEITCNKTCNKISTHASYGFLHVWIAIVQILFAYPC